jgi:hypothetical protein
MTSNFTKGAICMITEVSAYSVVKYENFKNSIPELTCPCHIKSTQKLVIEELISGGLALVSYLNKPDKLSVILLKDLRLVSET